ncbi:aspartyl protease family protein [Nonomuraea basaltis]|uniref:aspartyl protease family protein n=1 Tax=Nonomuraea basaltis TaxID=2495887 RepID=UPI00110C6EEA|nr:aspartyl protease family protein [Nonomuraea basaltis]TMR88788.1 hypothetical protein EJK15_64340 [Nonomuraea basaltis]
MADDRQWDRRSLLRGAAVLAGSAAAAPLLGGAATALAGSADADALFKAGKFEQAGRAYEEVLKQDPKNLRAARQRGYVGLLSNRFPDAEKYLKMALSLALDDQEANRFLADCYIRQDKLALSAPHWQAAGWGTYAKWFAAFSGEPYQVHGDAAVLPWTQMDPIPLVEGISINGGPAKKFTFYTGAPSLGVSATVAKEAGLNPVFSEETEYLNGTIWAHYGVLDSFKVGGIELRNLPVSWSATESGEDVDTDSDGIIGMWVFYHLLTTFDYAGQQLILRRSTPETAGKARAAAKRAGAEPLPMWLARDHQLHSRASIAGAVDSGPVVAGLSIGGSGESAAMMFGETAEKLRIRSDYDRPIQTFGHSHAAVAYPCYPKEIRVGAAAAQEVYCNMNPKASLTPYGFDLPVTFFHAFYKPYNLTLDFTGMNLYIARGPAN